MRALQGAISAASLRMSGPPSPITAKDVPKGSSVVRSGQVATMNSAFTGLLLGLFAAIVLVYF